MTLHPGSSLANIRASTSSIFILHFFKFPGETRAYCYIRKNGVHLIHTQSFVNSNTASGRDGLSNSLIVHLVHGDIVDLGLCTDIGTFYANSETSFSGFLFQND